MTFDAIETSARSARKVFLYVWQRGEVVWRYTSANRNLLVNFQTYLSAPIEHDNLEQGGEIERQNVGVTVNMLHPVALMFRQHSPADSVVLTISEYHATDPDTQVRPLWSGRIVSVRWDPEENQATITHSPTYASLQRNGLRRKYQANCPLVLYGLACSVNREAFKLVTTVGIISGLALTATGLGAQPDGYWNGGFIEYVPQGGMLERVGIRSHAGGVVQLSRPPQYLAAGMAVSIFPGCDRTTGANGCAKFGNLPNYGGFPHFPTKNPFGNDPVY